MHSLCMAGMHTVSCNVKTSYWQAQFFFVHVQCSLHVTWGLHVCVPVEPCPLKEHGMAQPKLTTCSPMNQCLGTIMVHLG